MVEIFPILNYIIEMWLKWQEEGDECLSSLQLYVEWTAVRGEGRPLTIDQVKLFMAKVLKDGRFLGKTGNWYFVGKLPQIARNYDGNRRFF